MTEAAVGERRLVWIDRVKAGGWPAALAWGVGLALAHRLLLTVWMVATWQIAGQYFDASVNFHDPGGDLPALTAPAEQVVFGVWRRWDAVHYLNLAAYGYRADYPGPTVFGILTPLGFRAFDTVLPGGIDAGAMAFQTAAFALALVFLYRVVEVYYRDPELAPWAVATLTITPLTYVFGAPLSESIYLALALGLFYFGAKGRWWAAAVCGLLATLARSQGAALIGVGLLIALESQPRGDSWRSHARKLVAAWPLAVIPVGVLAFSWYRSSLNLPPIDQIYAESSYVFFANPIEGLLINLRNLLATPLPEILTTPDVIALPVSFGLAFALLLFPKHRKPALLAYTFGFLLVFVSKINWLWGTDEVTFTQSLARYTVVLFPLTVLLADGLRRAPAWGRVAGAGTLLLLALGFASMSVLALTGP